MSKIGMIANTYWLAVPEHFGFIHPETCPIMPDHNYGLIEIECNVHAGIGYRFVNTSKTIQRTGLRIN